MQDTLAVNMSFRSGVGYRSNKVIILVILSPEAILMNGVCTMRIN